MNIKLTIKNKIKTIKSIIQSVVENDFFGMASEMGFMLCIGICPFMLFLTALFGWIGKHSFMNQHNDRDAILRLIKTQYVRAKKSNSKLGTGAWNGPLKV